jgi:AP-3 complex subunit beta
VPVISQIVSLAIKRGVGDMSPLVRKAAALAIPKCIRLDPGTEGQMVEHLGTLMGDKQYFVAGPAVMAFMEVCPERIDLVHKNYRGLVRKLVDMDEWSQLATLRLMLRYSRQCFPRRTRKVKWTGTKSFYRDEEEDQEEGEDVIDLDPDLKLLLDASKSLLRSRNAAVVTAVARCYIYLGTTPYIELCIGPLIALLRGSQDIQYTALHNVVQVCLINPKLFVGYSRHFLVRFTDPSYIWLLKLELLTLIYPHCEAHMRGIILSELEHFSRSSDAELVRESVRAIGRCAQNDPKTSNRCLRLLLKQVSSPDGNLVAESLTVIRHLIQQDPGAHTKTVIRLAKGLDTATNPQARASIIWLVGEFAGVGGEDNIAPDVLRILVKGFATEDEAAKLQIVLLAAKVYVHFLNRVQGTDEDRKKKEIDGANEMDSKIEDHNDNPESHIDKGHETGSQENHPIAILWRHILLLVRYDISYDLRDRTRLYKALLVVPTSTQLATLMLLAPKPVPHTPSPSESRKAFTLGSASLIIGDEGGPHGIKGYEPLPEWVEAGKEPDPKLREDGGGKVEYGEKRVVPAGERLDKAIRGSDRPAIVGADSTNGASATGKEKTLDDWLAESEEEDAEEDDDKSETSGEEESSEEESEEDVDENEQQNLVR